jgi:transcriptional regulator with XRE-family HTH domain
MYQMLDMAHQQVDSAALSRRLAGALQDKGWGYEDFHQRVRTAADGARGSSYGSVWSYVNGKVAEPRPRIVRAMADVLGVTYEWLATGDGPKTREELARSGSTPRAAALDAGADRLARLLAAMEGARERAPDPSAQLLARQDRVVERLVIDLLESDGRSFESYAEGEVAEATRLVTWLLTLPLIVLGGTEALSRRGRREAYTLSMTAALRLALADGPESRPHRVLDRLRRLRAQTRSFMGSETSSAGGSPAPRAH